MVVCRLLMMLTAAGSLAKDTGAGFLVGFLSSLLVRRWTLPRPQDAATA